MGELDAIKNYGRLLKQLKYLEKTIKSYKAEKKRLEMEIEQLRIKRDSLREELRELERKAEKMLDKRPKLAKVIGIKDEEEEVIELLSTVEKLDDVDISILEVDKALKIEDKLERDSLRRYAEEKRKKTANI